MPRPPKKFPPLTADQQQLVTDNYSLCPWAVGEHGPILIRHQITELYRCGATSDDLLSLAGEALCRAAINWKPDCGSLSLWFAYNFRQILSGALSYLKRKCRDSDHKVQVGEWAMIEPEAAEEPATNDVAVAGVVAAVATLPKQLQMIVKMRYGMEPYQRRYTLSQVAARFSLTKERVRQLQIKAEEQVLASLIRTPAKQN